MKSTVRTAVRKQSIIKESATTISNSEPSKGKTAQQWMALGKTGKAKHAYEAALGTGSWSKYIHNYLRNSIPTDNRCSFYLRPEPPLDNTFKTILLKAKNTVPRWNGRLYFVFLHSRERYEQGTEWPGYYRDYVLCTAKELDLPIIDIHNTVFLSHPDPLSLFPAREARHYNAEGYRLIAETIAKRLRKDKLFQ